MNFNQLQINDKFRLAGLDEILVKVEERWEDPFNPTNCENLQGESNGWVQDFQEVELVK